PFTSLPREPGARALQRLDRGLAGIERQTQRSRARAPIRQDHRTHPILIPILLAIIPQTLAVHVAEHVVWVRLGELELRATENLSNYNIMNKPQCAPGCTFLSTILSRHDFVGPDFVVSKSDRIFYSICVEKRSKRIGRDKPAALPEDGVASSRIELPM